MGQTDTQTDIKIYRLNRPRGRFSENHRRIWISVIRTGAKVNCLAQLVHFCSWRHWTRSSLPYSTEATKLLRSWRLVGHGGHNGFCDRFWYTYPYSINKLSVPRAHLVMTWGQWLTQQCLRNQILIYLLFKKPKSDHHSQRKVKLCKKVWSNLHFTFRNCDLKTYLYWSISQDFNTGLNRLW